MNYFEYFSHTFEKNSKFCMARTQKRKKGGDDENHQNFIFGLYSRCGASSCQHLQFEILSSLSVKAVIYTKSELATYLQSNMIQKVLLVALVLIAAQAIHLNQAHEAVIQGGRVTIKADNGDILSSCFSCGGSKTYSAVIKPGADLPEQYWIIEPVGDKVMIRGYYGKFLALCYDCFSGKIKESATVHGTESMPESLWTPEKLANGKYAFKGSNGKYLARCYYCANNCIYPNVAYVHVGSSSVKETQWTVTYEQ